MLIYYLKKDLKATGRVVIPLLSAAVLSSVLFAGISVLSGYRLQGIIISAVLLIITGVCSVIFSGLSFSKQKEILQKQSKKDLVHDEKRYLAAVFSDVFWSALSSICLFIAYLLQINSHIHDNSSSGTALGVIFMLFWMTFIFSVQSFVRLYICGNTVLKFKTNNSVKAFLLIYAIYLLIFTAIFSLFSRGSFNGLSDLPEIWSFIGSVCYYLFWTNLICSAISTFIGFWLYHDYIMQKRYLYKAR